MAPEGAGRRSLGDRIADLLAWEERAMTAREIARTLHVRQIDVAHVLEGDMRFYRWRTLHGRRKPYGVADVSEVGGGASEAREQSGAVL